MAEWVSTLSNQGKCREMTPPLTWPCNECETSRQLDSQGDPLRRLLKQGSALEKKKMVVLCSGQLFIFFTPPKDTCVHSMKLRPDENANFQ